MHAVAPFHWSLALSWLVPFLGGLGLPLGVPPLPEKLVMSSIAPEECLFYMSTAGTATPDPKSDNQTEQLLAEPEVQAMVAEIEKAIRAGLEQSKGRGGLADLSGDALVDAAKLSLTRPLAVYVISAEMHSGGPIVRGGIVIDCGDDAAKVAAQLSSIAKAATTRHDPRAGSQKLEIAGGAFEAIADRSMVWGLRGKLFVLALGDGEIDAMLKRVDGAPPAWLARLRQQLPVERTSTVTYVNVREIMKLALPMAGPGAADNAKALGLGNLTTIASVAGLDRKAFVNKTLIGIEGEPQGILRLADVKPLATADLAPIPHDATFALAFKLNPEEALDTIRQIVEKIDPSAKPDWQRGIDRIENVVGLKLREEILRPLGDTWCVFGAPEGGGPLYGLMATVPLKDPNQAALSHDKFLKLLRSQLASLDRKSSGRTPTYFMMPKLEELDFAGRRIHVFQGSPVGVFCAPAWCLTDKELIVGLHPQSIKAYLSRPASSKSLADAPAVARVFRRGSGPLKLLYGDSQRLLDFAYPTLLTYARFGLPMLRQYEIDLGVSVLPSPRALRPHLTPSVTSVRRTSSGIEITERRTLPGIGLTSSLPASVALLLPAVQSSRGAARQAQSSNNMKMLALAMHNYASVKGHFPPAYISTKDGKPLLSWRVQILPYLEQDALYKEFHLDEPWDSEHNKKLIASMPTVYKSPNSKVSGDGKTNYLTLRGEKTVFPGNKGINIAEIRDGTSNTIMTVEVPDDQAVVWTKPDDFQYDAKDPIKGLVGMWPGGILVGMCDGSVRFLPATIDAKTLNALFTRNGGEPISPDQIH